MDKFKPMLFPNDQVKPTDITGKYLISPKLDGVRCIFMDGRMYSRKLKVIPNIQLQKRFEALKEISKTGMILDGELYMHHTNFNTISGYVRRIDSVVPENLEFWCFDLLHEHVPNRTAYDRADSYWKALHGMPYVVPVPQLPVEDRAEIADYYHAFLEAGYEGAILKGIDSKYKLGRLTFKSKQGYKLKPYRTYDAIVVGIEQATRCRDDVPRTITELGKSKTSKKQEDRELIDKAGSFIVESNGVLSKVSLAMSDEEKIDVWMNQQKYIGRKIEFKAMEMGEGYLPRHPVFLRFRDDP